MSYSVTKKLLVGVVVATVMAMQVPASVFAATDAEVLTATQAGVQYLADNQNDDGSIAGFGGETDWTVMAVEASGQDAGTLENGSGVSATDFMAADVPGPTTDTTDLERRIIAIVAAGKDSSDFGGTNYNQLLADQHVNDQIGDVTLLNDDIFGVMAIAATEDPALVAAAQDALDYFLSHQDVGGGFSYTTAICAYCGPDSNDTAAAIIAMKAAVGLGLTNDGLDAAQANALVYLLSTQQDDGGFAYDVYSPSDGSSTAWGLMALNAIGESVKTQAMAARDWLLANQNDDGGFSYGAFGVTDSDTFTTAHAVLALLGTTWLLDPAPLQAAPEPPQAARPVIKTASSTPVEAKRTQTAAPAQPEVLAVESTTPQTTSDTSTKTDGKKDEAKPAAKKGSTNYTIYIIVVLALAASTWYLLQGKEKPAKAGKTKK